MKLSKTYNEFISEKKSKKKSPKDQIKSLSKKQKGLIDKARDIKDEVSKLSADKDKNPEDKLTTLLLKNKINQTEIDTQKVAIQKQQIALNTKLQNAKKKKKAMPKNEQLHAYADELSLEEGLFGWLSGLFKNPGLKRKVRKLKDELVKTRIEMGNLKLEGDPIEEFEAELEAKNDEYKTSKSTPRGQDTPHEIRIKALEDTEEALVNALDSMAEESEVLQKYVDKMKLEARMEANNAIIRAADNHIKKVIQKIQVKDKKAIKQMDGEIETLMKQDESYQNYLKSINISESVTEATVILHDLELNRFQKNKLDKHLKKHNIKIDKEEINSGGYKEITYSAQSKEDLMFLFKAAGGYYPDGGVQWIKESAINEEDSYNDYPAVAKKNAQMAIDWKEKYGRDEVDAGTAVGWARAHQLAKGENISADTIKRMASFNRHRKNSTIATEYKETPWKDKGYVSWLIWGGTEGVDWAMKKSKELDNMKESKHIQTFEAYKNSKTQGYQDKWSSKPKDHKYGKVKVSQGTTFIEFLDLIANGKFDAYYSQLIPKDKKWVEKEAAKQGFSEKELKRLAGIDESLVQDMYAKLLDSIFEGDEKPGPDPYMRGLSDEEEEKKKEKMKKQADMGDDNPKAYKEMPGDKEAREKGEVKTSKHVKNYHELYGDDETNEAFKFGKKNQYSIDDVNEAYGFWGTLEIAGFKRREIEDNWHSAMAWLTENYRFSDAGALYYLNAKAGRWIADQVVENRGRKDVVDVLEDYATPAEWKKWSKEYNRFAQEEMISESFTQVTEGVMSDIHILMDEVKDEDEFVKKFFKEYGAKIKKTSDSEKWVKDLYNDTMNEARLNEKVKIMLQNVLSKMIPAGFGVSTSPKMREEMREAVAKAIVPILKDYNYIVQESKDTDALASAINSAIISIDDSMHYRDFAEAVAKVIRDEYGSHLYVPFQKEIKKALKESVNEGKMPKKYIGNDEIVYLKTKEDSRGAHYNLYYKGHDIDVGGYRFGSEKELEDFASNYILSNQLYRKLRYEDSIPLPESVVTEATNVEVGEYIKTQYGYFYKRVDGKVGGQEAFVEIKKGKEGKRKTSIHDTTDFEIVDKSIALSESVVNEEKAKGDRGPIDDEKIEKALKTKSEETGVPIGLIRIVMRRGMAAWRTGHRPGATEQQWGYARVNAFLTKGDGTWGDADSDVAKEVRDGGHDKNLKKA